MDFEVEWNNIGWEPVFQTIKNGETDIGASGITITEERKESFDFTEPYYESQLLIVVKEDSKIKSLDELKDKKYLYKSMQLVIWRRKSYKGSKYKYYGF